MTVPSPPPSRPPGAPPPAVLAVLATVVALLLVGGVAALLANRAGDDEGEVARPPDTTTTTPTTGPPAEEITTTTAPVSTTETTSTTATTTSTTAPPTTTTTERATTTTVRVVCGSGQATTQFTARQPVVSGGQTSFVPEATVTNGVDRSIVVTDLAYDVRFDDGVVRRVTFDTGGAVLRPGATTTFTAERVSGPGQPRAAELAAFAYHTEGQPDACRVSR